MGFFVSLWEQLGPAAAEPAGFLVGSISQGAGCRAEQPGCAGEVESSLSGAVTSSGFGRIWKGLLHYDGAFEDLFSTVLPYSPSPLHWNLSSAQAISSGTGGASGTAERMDLTLVWPSAAVPVLLHHP